MPDRQKASTIPNQPCDGTCNRHDEEEPPTLESENKRQAYQAGEVNDEVDDTLETLESVAAANVRNATTLFLAVDLLTLAGQPGLIGDDLKRQFAEKISELIGVNHELDEALDRLDPCPGKIADELSGELSVGHTLAEGGQTVEESDVNAELLDACKIVNQCYQCKNGVPRQQHMCPDYTDDMPCSGFVDCGGRIGNEILQAAIAKATGEEVAP